MNTAPHPDWCTDGEASEAATVHRARDLTAGKWQVSLFQVDTNTPGTPVVHLRHPDMVEDHGQIEPREALALGLALIRQSLAALSRHIVHRAPHATRSSTSGPLDGGAP